RRRIFIRQLAANYHPIYRQSPTTQSTANPLHSCFSTTQHHHLHLRFGAVFCSEGRILMCGSAAGKHFRESLAKILLMTGLRRHAPQGYGAG
ncbi:hypothetical protein, partial [Ralstonia wenshanensis]|uniref:hypothetical protein n=1 Tax=Ralstonia wenshanensis TaxID=2842456 RepID=UPI0029305F4F